MTEAFRCDNCGEVPIGEGGIMYTSKDKAYLQCEKCGKYAIVLEIGQDLGNDLS